MSNVYFKPVKSYSDTDNVNKSSAAVLNAIIKCENISLERYVPLKVHFGEKGNKTFIKPENYNGIIGYLKDRSIISSYIETNALYKGQRISKKMHMELAKEHGFTQLPVIIADGDNGEEYDDIEINKKNFKSCKVARAIAEQKQIIVLSHFKGHILAGFGGAIKQLGMGCASKGGKLAQHANSIPKISYFKCKACGACAKVCPKCAITIAPKAKIDKDKCIGCASCMAVCPNDAISNSWVSSISKSFNERLAEYAYAAAKGRNNIYINFALNITRGCDCEGHNMKVITNDTGIFASTDPVAVDKACIDIINKRAGKKIFTRGKYTLEYAEKIGLGSMDYKLIEL